MIVELILATFLTLLIPLIVPFFSVRLYEINPEYFRKVKIRKLSFMFRGIGGKESIYGDVRNYGVIIPIFVVQIIGYLLTLIQLIMIPLLYIFVSISYITIIVIGSVFCAYIIGLTIVSLVCIGISKRKEDLN